MIHLVSTDSHCKTVPILQEHVRNVVFKQCVYCRYEVCMCRLGLGIEAIHCLPLLLAFAPDCLFACCVRIKWPQDRAKIWLLPQLMACLGIVRFISFTHNFRALNSHAFFPQFFLRRIEQSFCIRHSCNENTNLSTANACAPGHRLECITASEYWGIKVEDFCAVHGGMLSTSVNTKIQVKNFKRVLSDIALI